jgi:hypothetical protein
VDDGRHKPQHGPTERLRMSPYYYEARATLLVLFGLTCLIGFVMWFNWLRGNNGGGDEEET